MPFARSALLVQCALHTHNAVPALLAHRALPVIIALFAHNAQPVHSAVYTHSALHALL